MKAIADGRYTLEVVDGVVKGVPKFLSVLLRQVAAEQPIPMLLYCPMCGFRHLDEGEFATKPHHTHACQECGHVWRQAIVPTVGVQFLPGFKNEGSK